jgi:acyl-CoA synthetase (AMP-forming)/AMP-acid ligase II
MRESPMRQPLLTDIINLHGRWRAERPALITDDETLYWSTFGARVNRVANGLIAAGCGQGARVGVVMDNSTAMVEVMFGAMKAGAVVAPLNTSVADDAIDAMLRDAGVAAVFTTPAHQGRISSRVLAQAKLHIVANGQAAAPWTSYAAWRDSQAPDAPGVVLAPDAACNIIYSSGTTGQPKGIVHTHQGRLDWAHDLGHALRYHCGARLLIATGLYSNISWAGMLPTLILGGTLVIRPGFDALDILKTIARERITHASMVPVQFQRLLEHPEFEAHDRSSVLAMMCCGAPLPLHVKEALFEKFACGVIELYGSTEGVITTLAPEEAPGRMASVGKPLPGEDILILDGDDRPVAVGEPGEIVALSRFAMTGYWNKPEATAETFWIDAQGRKWLRSGDIGRLDAESYLFITDRKKDMIISGGQNIYPADLESVLVRHPDVSDCAVFGVPSERWGETPLALVVLREGASIKADALRDWTNAQLGKQQRLSAVELRSSLPRNANGKLLKRELRAPYWAGADRRV